MEDGKIIIKRINSFKIREDRPPMIVILSDENVRYYYQESSPDVSRTLEDLVLAMPGDKLKIKYSIKKAFLDKDNLHKMFSAELIFD